jgi:hypothetical protein
MGVGYCSECDCYRGHKAHCSKLFTQIASMNTNAHLEAELKSIDKAIDDPRLNLTHTAAEIIYEMRLQLARLQTDLMWLQDNINPERKKIVRRITMALAAIDDAKLLEGLVLCDAEPVAELRISSHACDPSLIVKWCSAMPVGTKLYARRKP